MKIFNATHTDRSDRLLGGSGKDTIIAGAGDDFISGDAGNRVNPAYIDWAVTPVAGFPFDFRDEHTSINDEPVNTNQDDTIYAGSGKDQVVGGNGNDSIFGEEGDDVLAGNDGANTSISAVVGLQVAGDPRQYWIYAESSCSYAERVTNQLLVANDAVWSNAA